ncbi:MAG: 4Fe-4S binding protein [Lachnospiraceae bacterium]|nr:4Fe-4S binding protein [Lachnospiraceae bacterium]
MALGFYFDMTSCYGCRTCQVACKDKNNLDIGVIFRNTTCREVGAFPAPDAFHFSATCNHCENPACVAACASGAMYKTPEGPVLVDAELCDGCGACVTICPYEVPKMLASGVVGKCDTCIGLRKNGNNPACVDACIMRAIEFGEIDELKAAHPDAVSISELPFMPEDVTGPTTLVSAKKIAYDEKAIVKYI